ncbi:hypothetical protein [Novosphingobium sp. Fuku2-ISO-50]|uniref:hypothetical protein n=1 Tax=Novosphingobium sp. Fuku2-ISO-50 TaxID=1739114 RepID=UPI00076D93CE|nr:hypothetical protein [Novosphingobium sp. Fuku2-ISO-50]KUR81103.1 hypothetical protein AQZ50_00535 [Novosphingobium sp. Fuku2-ISO-50]
MAVLAFARAKLKVGDISSLEAFYTGAFGFVVTTRIAVDVAHGGRDLTGAIEIPEWAMRPAFVCDPGGHQIELIQATA